ncbi:MAG: hypothetical protein ACK4NT_05945, partial [Candidatus Omnitrophota bacterium]
FFRFLSEVVKNYFDEQIHLKVSNEDYKWNIKSIAGATGAEAYSIAMILHDRLENYARTKIFHNLPDGQREKSVKEWLERWRVVIELYDIATPSLLIAKQGRYNYAEIFEVRSSAVPRTQYVNSLLEKYIIDTDKPNIKEVYPELQAWVKPKYINLTEEIQLERLKSQHEVVFFMYSDIPAPREATVIKIAKEFFNQKYKGLLFLSALQYEIIPPP